MDTRPQQARGISTVNDIVQGSMKLGWEEISQINDNGIDGIMIDRKKGIDTGNFYYVQVKCGDSYRITTKKRENQFIEIQLGEEYIQTHRLRWNRIPNPVILVYVEDKPKNRKCWWVNLKSEETYSKENKGLILIKKEQRFEEHSIGEIRKLREHFEIDKDLKIIKLTKQDLISNSFSKTLKKSAREFYLKWSKLPSKLRTHPLLGEINVSRIGWKHITRLGRGLANIEQSWTLLGAAKKIITTNCHAYQIRKQDTIDDTVNSKKIIHDYLSLRCRVLFPNRQECVVQVVIKRIREIDLRTSDSSIRLWFYSVYEPRRHKKAKKK